MFKRILVPLDGSQFAEKALPMSLGLAQRWDASVDLVTVAAPEAHGEDPGVSGLTAESGVQLAREQAGAYLESVESRVRDAGFEGEITRKALPAGNIWRALVSHLLDQVQRRRIRGQRHRSRAVRGPRADPHRGAAGR